MDQKAEKLARAIGTRVKQERKRLGWTLDRLATLSGVSRRMLVNVERGSVNPSVGTLLRLSDALGIGLPSLVEPPSGHTTRLTRRGEGAVLWRGNAGGQGVLIAGTESPNIIELWDWTLAPGEHYVSEPHSDGTRELLQVHEGALTLEADRDVYTLRPGDALTFRGDAAHSYANRSSTPTRFSLAVYEPEVGSSRRLGTG